MISAIIPTRNRAGHVGTAIRSVLAQGPFDLEVVVVDDGSTDSTPTVLTQMAREDARIRVLRQPTAGGASRARNRGAAAARGSTLAFQDDDCVWAPEKLARQVPLLTPMTGVVYCRQAIRSSDGRWIIDGEGGAAVNPVESLLRTNYIGTPSLVVSRGAFESAGGFDEALPRLQDWDLLLRLGRTTGFAFVPEILVKGVEVEGGITLTSGPLPEAARRVVQRHEAFLSPRQQAALHYGLGKFLLADGHAGPARAFFHRSVRLHPTSPLNWAGLLASLLGPAPARVVRNWRRGRRAATVADDWDWSSGRGSDRSMEPR